MSRPDPKRMVEILREACDDLDSGARVRRYSGRAMYGKQCVGVDTNTSGHDIVAAAMLVAETDAEREDLADLFRDTKTDSMGLGVIVYWPKAEWPADLDDEDDDEGDEE